MFKILKKGWNKIKSQATPLQVGIQLPMTYQLHQVRDIKTNSALVTTCNYHLCPKLTGHSDRQVWIIICHSMKQLFWYWTLPGMQCSTRWNCRLYLHHHQRAQCSAYFDKSIGRFRTHNCSGIGCGWGVHKYGRSALLLFCFFPFLICFSNSEGAPPSIKEICWRGVNEARWSLAK